MDVDFSKDVVVSFSNMVADIKSYKTFGRKELEEALNKLFVLRENPKFKDFKIIGMHIAGDVDLPIKSKMITKCFLKTDENEILTDSIELDILSTTEAEKNENLDDEKTRWLRFIGASTKAKRDKIAEGNELLMDLAKTIDEISNSKEFQEELKNE